MSQKQIDDFLARTLQDGRLSTSEKKALAQVIDDSHLDEQRLALCRHRAFELVSGALSNPNDRQVIDWLEDVLKLLRPSVMEEPAGQSEAFFSPGTDCPARIASLLRDAKRSIDICVFTITDDRISTAILDAHQRGIPLRILTDNDKSFDEGSDIPKFQAVGIPVREDRTAYHMHHKFAIFDREILLTGSYNWTRGAAIHNEENFIVTPDRRLIAQFSKVFDRLWKSLV